MQDALDEDSTEWVVRASEYDFSGENVIYHDDTLSESENVVVSPAPMIPYSESFARSSGSSEWVYSNGNWYYYLNGSLVTNSWVEDSVDWCYVGSDGAAYKSRWARLSDSSGLYWYNFDADCHIRRSQWEPDAHDWCYIDKEGHAVQNKFARVSDSSGVYSYYFTNCCCIARSTWVVDMASDVARWVDADGHAFGIGLLDPLIV